MHLILKYTIGGTTSTTTNIFKTLSFNRETNSSLYCKESYLTILSDIEIIHSTYKVPFLVESSFLLWVANFIRYNMQTENI